MKLAINGFGRIGRPSLKIALEKDDLEVVAINDLSDVETLAYLLRYDSVYGLYQRNVKTEKVPGKDYNWLIIDDHKIRVYAERDPQKLPWKDLDVDVVLECTGVFRDYAGAQQHLTAGARKVVISAPAKDKKVKTVVLGVNHMEIAPEDSIFSNASCTTNSVAPLMKVLKDRFGVEKSLMTTIHSYTSTQNLVDGANKDYRRGRAAAENIIPATTGAAIATTKVVSDLQERFDGLAFRVPTPAGSVSDLTAVLSRSVTAEEVNEALTTAATGELQGIIATTEEPLVVKDIIGNPHSVIVQTELTKVIGGDLVKIVGWYDNEWGYANRLVELAQLVGG